MARVSVLPPDAGPLFTLAAADALDLLGAAELDVQAEIAHDIAARAAAALRVPAE
jgi:hypothetical protein